MSDTRDLYDGPDEAGRLIPKPALQEAIGRYYWKNGKKFVDPTWWHRHFPARAFDSAAPENRSERVRAYLEWLRGRFAWTARDLPAEEGPKGRAVDAGDDEAVTRARLQAAYNAKLRGAA